MSFFIQFLLPLFAVLTAGLILIIIWSMKNAKKHEENEQRRHETVKGTQDSIVKEIEKVGKKLDAEIIPKLSTSYKRKSGEYFEITTSGVKGALESIGFSNFFTSQDDGMILVGIDHGDENDSFRLYFFLNINEESKDLMIEGYGYELAEFDFQAAKTLLHFNDKYKVCGATIEEINNRHFIKVGYLLDAQDGTFHSKTLDFALLSLTSVFSDISSTFSSQERQLEFIEPHELLSLQFEEGDPTQAE